jgi:hypothetical protein
MSPSLGDGTVTLRPCNPISCSSSMAAPTAAEERAAALTWGEQERRAELGWWLWRCALLGTGQAGWCEDARWREKVAVLFLGGREGVVAHWGD